MNVLNEVYVPTTEVKKTSEGKVLDNCIIS